MHLKLLKTINFLSMDCVIRRQRMRAKTLWFTFSRLIKASYIQLHQFNAVRTALVFVVCMNGI